VAKSTATFFLYWYLYEWRILKIMSKRRLLISTLVLAVVPAFGAYTAHAQEENPGRPGTINYIEGSVSIDGRTISPDAVGSAALNPGDVLSTANGKVEMLLTPGVFFRLDGTSSAKLVSPSLTKTVVELESGRAAVEVDQLFAQNDIQINEKGKTTQLVKPGLYEFNAGSGEVKVFEGRAEVLNQGDKWTTIKGHHALVLTEGTQLKSQGFNTDAARDDLYNWSSLRSQYLAQANAQIAGEYNYAGFAPGWYWDPYAYDYTFIGMNPFWSPFGWGFYGRGFYGGGFYGRGFYGRGYEGRGFGGRGFSGMGGSRGGGFAGGGGAHGGGGHR
jgi:uncharacterized membrane protein YgcG